MYIDSAIKAWDGFIAAISFVTTGPDSHLPLALRNESRIKLMPMPMVGVLARAMNAAAAAAWAKDMSSNVTPVEMIYDGTQRWQLLWAYSDGPVIRLRINLEPNGHEYELEALHKDGPFKGLPIPDEGSVAALVVARHVIET